MSKEAMKLALEAMKTVYWHGGGSCWIVDAEKLEDAERALEEALASEQEQRCKYCDGTGDVHDQTGEWRGVCVCEAGAKQEQGEPDKNIENLLEAYWRLAFDEGKTGESHGDAANEVLFALRYLYTTPQQRKPLTDEQLIDLWPSLIMHQHTYAFARAIEAAHGIKE